MYVALLLLTLSITGFTQPLWSKLESGSDTSWSITTESDAQRLRALIKKGLQKLSDEQMKRSKQKKGKSFTLPQAFVEKQRKARAQFGQELLPLITKDLHEGQDGALSPLRVMSIKKIETLSTEQTVTVLKAIFNLMGLFPPAPAEAADWAATFTPLLSFDGEAQATIGERLSEWLTILEKHPEDLAMLAQMSQKEQKEQLATLKKLQQKHQEAAQTLSQMLYPWLQASAALDTRQSLEAFINHATAQPQEIIAQLQRLRKQVKKVMEKAQSKSASDTDVDGFIMLAIASLFTPQELWETLVKQQAQQQNQE